MTTILPVTIKAITDRINRKLKHDNQKLMKIPAKFRAGYGEHGIVDTETNTITSHNIELEALAQELGCLKPYENMEVKP